MILLNNKYGTQEETFMVFEPDARIKRKMSKDGSVLKFMYSVAGVGKGLVAMGAMLVPIGLLLGVALADLIGTLRAFVIIAVCAIPGLLLIIGGITLQNRRVGNWMKAYMKRSSVTEEDIHRLEQEFQQPGALLFSAVKGKDTNSLKKMGIITDHYVKFPGIMPYIVRQEDLVAFFYTKKYQCDDGGFDKALVAYGTNSEYCYVAREEGSEKANLEIVQAIASRNPMVITDHHFAYEGKEYDAVRGLEEVIALHKRIRAQQQA